MLAGNILLRNVGIKALGDSLTNAWCGFNNIILESRRYAGHSHWKNIKATKEARDDQRQRLICAFVRKINVAVELGGGQTNPKLNGMLAKLLEEGKANDIPSATIEKALKRLESKKTAAGVSFTVGARSLTNGATFIIESQSEKQKHFRMLIQSVMKKFGGTIAEMGVCTHLFERKGVICVPSGSNQKDGNKSKMGLEEASDLAIEAGAEDVFEELDENNEPFFKFVCDMKQFSNVKKFIESQNLKTFGARLEYMPKTPLKLEGENLELVSRTIDALESMDDCEAVYHNVVPATDE